jgi:hypothetical protein
VNDKLTQNIDYILPVATPILINGSVYLNITGTIQLTQRDSFVCTTGNFTLNGSVIVYIDKKEKLGKNNTIILCANSYNSSLIIGNNFNLKAKYLGDLKECKKYKTIISNITENTLSIKSDIYEEDECLQSEYIITIILVTTGLITLILTLAIITILIIVIYLFYKKKHYKKKISITEQDKEHWQEIYLHFVNNYTWYPRTNQKSIPEWQNENGTMRKEY